MDFLAVLDYEHLDNGVFLTSFARSLAQKKERGIVIHGDSEYTERIIQTGVMRKEARIRAIKELNHRLVALFADQGISTIAVNGYQKSMVTTDGDDLTINQDQINSFPPQPTLLLSNLALNKISKTPEPVSLPNLADRLSKLFNLSRITLFSIDDSAEIIKKEFPENINLQDANKDLIKDHIPKSFREYHGEVRLTTASSF